jgi:cathepsin B
MSVQRFPANTVSPGRRPSVYPVFATRLDSHAPVPPSFDCRERWPGLMIEPFLQKCGSCWAYASVGMLADRTAIATGRRVSLSVDYLFFCNNLSTFLGAPATPKPEFEPSAGVREMRTFECSGDHVVSALYYLFFQGTVDEKCGNHTGVVDTLYCSNDTLGTNIHKGCVSYYGETRDVCAYTILSGGLFRGKPARFFKGFVPYNHESLAALQQDMMEHGPVATTMDAYGDLWTFDAKKSIYARGRDAAFVSGHAVLLVGWGVSERGEPYWVVQNSWGTEWGRSGFFWIRRGRDECGIESNALGARARVHNTPLLSYAVDLLRGYRIDPGAYRRINELYREKIRYSGISAAISTDSIDVLLSLATDLSVGEVVFGEDGYTYDGKAVFPGLRYETITGVPAIRDTTQAALLGTAVAALAAAFVLFGSAIVTEIKNKII